MTTTHHDHGRHHRRSIRLRGYDYAQPGAYFVTICTHRHAHLFGKVVDGEMQPNAFGEIVREEWFRTAEIRANVLLYDYEFVVMPNHIHGIIRIVDVPSGPVGAQRRCAPSSGRRRGDPQVAPTAPTTPTEHTAAQPAGPPTGSLGAIIAGFKSAVTKRINLMRGTPGARVWQRNYYEHIIRTNRALDSIRRYIAQNPIRWHLDRYNESAIGPDPLALELWQIIQEDATRPPGEPGK